MGPRQPDREVALRPGRRRALAAGGVVGPVTFICCWAALGATTAGYDPTRTAISRLAAIGAASRPAMTAGLVVLAGGMGLYAAALRPARAWIPAAANALTTVAVAAIPLGSGHDTAHGISAALSYLTLAAIPLTSATELPAGSARRRVAVAVGMAAGVCLVTSVLGPRPGLFQRLGLSVALLWVVADALRMLRGR